MDNRALVGVIDDLTSDSTTDSLSANQGRVLKEMIDSTLPLLVGTMDNDIVIGNLSTGVYKITGAYRYCDSSLTPIATDEHILVIVVDRGSEVHYTLFSPTGVMRRVIIKNGEITVNHYLHIQESNIIFDGKVIPLIDNSYSNIILKSGITAHNSTNFPIRCKKQGNVVFIEGAVKGITKEACEIGTLPVGYRPIGKKIYYLQSRLGGKIDTLQISPNGLIEIMNSTATTFNASDYHFISTSFII